MKTLDDLINQAEKALSQANQLLETFNQEWEQSGEHPLNDVNNIRTMQLVLQYRLDTQSALYQLSKLQLNLLQLLGIEPKHSVEMNIERLTYALGTDDLQQILSMLNRLVDALLKIISNYQHQQILDRKQSLERLKSQKYINVMVKVLANQKTFVEKMEELKLAIDDVGGVPQPGLVLDEIAALQGPVSRFQQALQNGLILSGGLYQQLQQKNNLQLMLADTIQKTDQALRNYNYRPEQQQLFTPSLEDNKIESLEQRATIKRLSPFFGH